MSAFVLAVGAGCEDEPAPKNVRALPLSIISGRLPKAPPEQVEEAPPLPGDGLASARAAQAAREAAFDARFPYHGVAFHMLAQVFHEPVAGAPVAGYLRRGSRFRAGPGVTGPGCGTRWHEVDGGGFICAGRGFIVGTLPQDFSPAPAAPDLQDQLPYTYARTLAKDVPQYFHLPTPQEEVETGQAIVRMRELLQSAPPAEPQTLVPSGSVATATGSAGEPAEAPAQPRILPDYVRMTMRPGFYVSVDGYETAPSGKRFARTVRGAYVAADRLQPATPSPFAGRVLGATGLKKPLGLVHLARARTKRRDPITGEWVDGDSLTRFQTVRIRGGAVRIGTRDYWPTDEGVWVDTQGVRVARKAPRPSLVPSRARWVDVNLKQQVLVAYEGDRPVFATLVATGKEGYETPVGLFRLHAKHVSATMDGENGTDEVYSIEDVPWTMYFKGSLALHAAFWHDRFGRVRSHGCINLAPSDARFLFGWTSPGLPSGFHGVMPALREVSTYVSIRDGEQADS